LGGSPSSARTRSRRAVSALLVGALCALVSPVVHADDDVGYKHGSFLEQGKMLTITVGFREMMNSVLHGRLRDGFSTTVVMRLYLYERSSGQLVAFSARTLKAVYDLWDEQYLLRIEEPGKNRSAHERREQRVVDLLTSCWRFPLVGLDRLKPGTQYFVAVIAEVNPMSEELLEEVRRWLRNPAGEHRRGSEGSLFGSFVSIFVNNKIRSAEKTFRFRTQPFYRRP
jgi:hypothetical protein